MKHGRSLIAALNALAAADDGDPTRSGRGSAARDPSTAPSELRAIRPGAFAAWAARRADGTPRRDGRRVARPAAMRRLLGRPRAV